MLKEAAEKTNKEAGDGTTSTVVLSHAMAKEGLRYIRSGVNPFSLGKGLFAGIEAVANAVKVTMGPKGRNVVLERAY